MIIAMSCALALILWPSASRTTSSTVAAGIEALVSARSRDGPRGNEQLSLQPNQRAAEVRLLAACLDAGLSPITALEAVASISPIPHWSSVTTMLTVGVDPATAWRRLAEVPGLEDMSVVARNALRSGAAMSKGCVRIAEQLEEKARDESVARAEKAGVLIAAPLSLCFLPAFIVLGLIPLIINLGATVF